MEAVNIYPKQLRCILHYLEALDAADAKIIEEGMGHAPDSASIEKIAVMDHDHEMILGHLVDEIGGAWSFRAAMEGS